MIAPLVSPAMKSFWSHKNLLSVLAVLFVSGCVPVGKNTHIILGLGLFHVEQTNEVTVVRAKSLGLYAGDGRLNAGMSSIYSAHVPTNAEVILEIK